MGGWLCFFPVELCLKHRMWPTESLHWMLNLFPHTMSRACLTSTDYILTRRIIVRERDMTFWSFNYKLKLLYNEDISAHEHGKQLLLPLLCWKTEWINRTFIEETPTNWYLGILTDIHIYYKPSYCIELLRLSRYYIECCCLVTES